MIDRPGLYPGEAEQLAATVAAGIKLNDDDFQFTCYAFEEVYPKLDFTIFKQLNEQIQLQQFGEGLKVVGFAFIALPYSQEHGIRYFPNHKEVSISLTLDYEQFLAATPEEAITMMKQVYLNGLHVLPLFAISDFDVAGLIEAVEVALRA